MLQNIKVDILYYCTNTDFEMEFNLCGCARIRLLNDKSDTRKAFILSLSRAVSRSKVIICCGPLFGEKGVINNVATAIDKGLATVDNSAYGIKGDNKVEIIDGGMPLVSPDGVFGGCIIEEGPQSIIILSENRTVRKSIMTTLIHPYIEQLSLMPTAKAEEETAQNQVALTEEEPVAQTEQEVEEQVEETEAEPQEEPQDVAEDEPVAEPDDMVISADAVIEDTDIEVEDETVVLPEDEKETEMPDDMLITAAQEDDAAVDMLEEFEDVGLYIEPQQVKFSKKHYYDVDYEAGADSDQYYAEPEPIDYNSLYRLPILICAILFLAAVAVLLYFLVFVPIRDGYTFTEYVKTIFSAGKVGIMHIL